MGEVCNFFRIFQPPLPSPCEIKSHHSPLLLIFSKKRSVALTLHVALYKVEILKHTISSNEKLPRKNPAMCQRFFHLSKFKLCTQHPTSIYIRLIFNRYFSLSIGKSMAKYSHQFFGIGLLRQKKPVVFFVAWERRSRFDRRRTRK